MNPNDPDVYIIERASNRTDRPTPQAVQSAYEFQVTYGAKLGAKLTITNCWLAPPRLQKLHQPHRPMVLATTQERPTKMNATTIEININGRTAKVTIASEHLNDPMMKAVMEAVYRSLCQPPTVTTNIVPDLKGN